MHGQTKNWRIRRIDLGTSAADGRVLGSSPGGIDRCLDVLWAAPSMLRLRSNCTVIELLPSVLERSLRPARDLWIGARCARSPDDASVLAGTASGKLSVHLDGRECDLRQWRDRQKRISDAPIIRMPAMSRRVAIGRRMNGVEMGMM